MANIGLFSYKDERYMKVKTRMLSKGLCLSLILPLCWSGNIQAKDLDLHFSGFATLGFTNNNSDELQFHHDYTMNTHEGLSFATSSMIGGQVNLDLSDSWDVVAQAVYQDRVSNKLNDYFEWAFVRRRFGRNWAVRVGRLHAGLYMLSEYKTVAFAYPWTHPSVEFYGLAVSVSQLDGLDVEYSSNIGSGFLRAKLAYGKSEARMQGMAGDFSMKFDEVRVGDISYSQDNWMLVASVAKIKIDDFPIISPLVNALKGVPATLWPEIDEVINDVNYEGHHVHYTGVGYRYDDDSWLIQAEYSNITSKWALLPSYTSGYLSGGYKVNNVTFYSMASFVRPKNKSLLVPSPTIFEGMPPQLAEDLQGLHAGVEDSIRESVMKQKTFSLGARWDFRDNMSLKLQVDRTLVYANGAALWTSSSPLRSNQYVTLFSANINMVF